MVIKEILKAKTLAVLLLAIVIAAGAGAAWQLYRIGHIAQFNQDVLEGKIPASETLSFEARFAAAYWQARRGQHQDATLLFLQLTESGNASQRSAVQFNLGNIAFVRGIAINGQDLTVHNEATYLFKQARAAYMQSLRLDETHWDARHNLDRILMMMPEEESPGVGESDSPGLLMGNVPVGLP